MHTRAHTAAVNRMNSKDMSLQSADWSVGLNNKSSSTQAVTSPSYPACAHCAGCPDCCKACGAGSARNTEGGGAGHHGCICRGQCNCTGGGGGCKGHTQAHTGRSCQRMHAPLCSDAHMSCFPSHSYVLDHVCILTRWLICLVSKTWTMRPTCKPLLLHHCPLTMYAIPSSSSSSSTLFIVASRTWRRLPTCLLPATTMPS